MQDLQRPAGMTGHHSHSRSINDDHHLTVPCSPGASPKPGSPASSITRFGSSNGGGSATSNSTCNGGSYAGSYANRHSISQLAAAASGEIPASRVSSGGRSMQASRRASIVADSPAHQPSHHRTASHGASDVAGFVSSSVAHEKRGFYSKMLSYGRRASSPNSNSSTSSQHFLPDDVMQSPKSASNLCTALAETAASAGSSADHLPLVAGLRSPGQQQRLAPQSSVPELILVGDNHPALSSSTSNIADHGVAAALAGDAAAVAAAAGLVVSPDVGFTDLIHLDGAHVAEPQHSAKAQTSSKNLSMDSTELTTVHALHSGSNSSSNAYPATSSSSTHNPDSGTGLAVIVPASAATEDESNSSSKADSKPSTPTERAMALARAALDALHPQLRKSRKSTDEPKVRMSQKQKKAAAKAAAKAAETRQPEQQNEVVSVVNEAEDTCEAESSAGEVQATSAAADHKTVEPPAQTWAARVAATPGAQPELAKKLNKTEEKSPHALPRADCESNASKLNYAAAVKAAAAAAATASCADAHRNAQQEHQSHLAPAAPAALQSSRGFLKMQQEHTAASPRPHGAQHAVHAAAACCGVAGDMTDTARAVSLNLVELAEYYRASNEDGTASNCAAAALSDPAAASPQAAAAPGNEPLGARNLEAADHTQVATAISAAIEESCQPGGISATSTAVCASLAHKNSSTVAKDNSSGAQPDGMQGPAAASSSSADTAAVAAATPVSSIPDYRYSELIFRLQQFLPALKAADASSADFESTWESIKVCHSKDTPQPQHHQREQHPLATIMEGSEALTDPVTCLSELTALVNTAKLAQLQTGRLEALDAEVAQLQKLLVQVGKNIKAGAQQQQLRDLFCTFPSFARRQLMDNSEPSSPAAAAPAPAAMPKPLVQTIAQLVANQSKFPHNSEGHGRWSTDLHTDGSTWSHGWSTPSNTSGGGSHADSTVSCATGVGSGGGAAAAATASESISPPLRGSLLSGTLPGSNKQRAGGGSSGSSSAVRRSLGGLTALPGANEGGWHVKRSVSPPPLPKVLTAEEGEQLASLYKVVNDKPDRIFYKELKLAHHKSSGGGNRRYSDGSSPNTSPRHPANAAAPTAAASWRRTVSPTPEAALPAVAAAPAPQTSAEYSAAPALAAAKEQLFEHQCPVRSIDNPMCDPLYSSCSVDGLSALACRTGDAYGSSGLALSSGTRPNAAAVRSSWSAPSGVTKGFRVLRAIPEAHKKPLYPVPSATVLKTGSGREEQKGGSNSSGANSRSNRSQSSPPGTHALYDARLQSCYPHHRAAGSLSPDKCGLPAARQQRRLSSPLRHSIAQTQFREQRMSKSQQQQQPLTPWSYPRSREQHLLPSRKGSLITANSSSSDMIAAASGAAATGPVIPTVYVRARSTSPSIGMHYLERSPSGRNIGAARSASASVRSSYASGSVAGISSGTAVPRGDGAPAVPGSPGKASGAAAAAAPPPVLADDFRFVEACKAFLDRHASAVAAEGLSPTKALGTEGGARLAAKLSPMKDADSRQIDAAMIRLAATLRSYSVNLELRRMGPCLYSAAGRKLRIRMLNGNLLVRTGGGHEGLLDALGKLPLSAVDGSSNSSSAVMAVLQHGSGNSSSEEPVDDSCCYATLAAEAAAAATATDHAASSAATAEQQQQRGATLHEDAVAVVRVDEGSGLGVQCAAGAGGNNADAWTALVTEAVEQGRKAMAVHAAGV